MLIPLLLSIGLAALAWLVPNHTFPWPAFYSDLAMAAALTVWVAALLVRRAGSGAWPALALGALALAAVPMLQVAAGLIRFGGDGFVASLYVVGFALAMWVGAASGRWPWSGRASEVWFGLMLAVGVLSVWIQFDQWLDLRQFGLYGAASAGRPGGNLAQPNQMATLLMFAFIGALVLHQQRRIGMVGLVVLTAWLGYGMVMTQSRAVWVELVFVFGWLLVMQRRAVLRIGRKGLAALGALLAGLFLAWLPLVGRLLLEDARSVPGGGRTEAGARPVHWASMLDALSQQPLFGYGWNQVAVAQSRVAAGHRATGEFIEHSHSMLLDLLVWNGVPLGLLVIGAVAWWFWRHLRTCRDATVAFLLACIGAVLAHALVEFPLDYAYFLIPVGFMMGCVEALSPAGRLVAVPRAATAAVALGAAVALAAMATEYVRAEDNLTTLRFESARIGTPRITSEVPELLLLTQLREFLRFGRTEAVAGMSPAQLDWMHDVSERYGYPPVLFRYALAAGLNGRPDEARRTLVRLTRIHPKYLLPEAQENWRSLTAQHPELAAVPFPALP